jgi:dihydrofolate reductase
MNSAPNLTIIVAIDAARGIGIDNTLPWRLPQDLAHFKRLTSGHAIIMGRNTFDSIGRPLPNRRNIVLTRDPAWAHAGVERASSLADAIALAGDAPAFVIGGAEVYAQALPLVSRLIVTEIDKNFPCDSFFPPINAVEWEQTAREEYYSLENEFGYAFVYYLRRQLAQ